METVIDWSEAPEGCVGALIATTKNIHFPKVTFVGLAIFETGRVRGTSCEGHELCAYLDSWIWEDKPWQGDGLPPVGVVCEVLWDSQLGIYCAAAVLAHDEAGAVYRLTTGERKGEYQSEQQDYYSGLPKFRPIRTPEQIAAGLRQKEINEMAECIAAWSCDEPPLPRHTQLAEHLYDNFYSKQVAP